MNIPFSPPDISEVEIDEVVDTLRSGWITTGLKTKLFENKISEFSDTTRTVCLNSATAALELTLRLLGVGPNDEVITSAYTYSASASVIKHVGAKVVLIDTGKDTFEMDYDQLEYAITKNTKVIIPVDIAGIMCDYDRINEIVNRKSHLFQPSNKIQQSFSRAVILADAAHSFGAVRKGKKSGNAADFTCFSFHAVKNLTTGEGGAVTWRSIHGYEDEEVYNEYMLLSLHGQSKDALEKAQIGSWEYDIVYPGYKFNMTDIAASIGIGQLTRYSQMLIRRKQMVERYNNYFDGYPIDTLKHYGDDFSSSGHLYLIRLVGKDEQFRNHVINEMARRNISTNVHYKPLPMHTAYQEMGFNIKDFPNAFDMYKNEITLPLYTKLTNGQIDYISENLIKIIAD